MANLELSTLIDCLDVVCLIHNKERSEIMTEIYFESLGDLDDDLITKAFRSVLDERYFPTPARIRELATGIVADADWHTIMAVASGTTKSATISGISAIALTTATATSSILAALKKVSFCDDPYRLREIRQDWSKLASISRLDSTLPPTDVEITLTVKTATNNFEHPADDDFTFRTASMIRCIRDKGSISPAWLPIIDQFPATKKREVLDAIEANNWHTPELKESKLYRRYQTTAEAMREISETEINQAILSSRQTAVA